MKKFREWYTSRKLLRAIDRTISEHGWIQGNSVGPHGEVCLLQALLTTILMRDGDGAWSKHPVTGRIRNVIGHHSHSPWPAIPSWNDAPERTEADVHQVLKEAAKWSTVPFFAPSLGSY